MSDEPLPSISDIADAANPERLMPRKCVGCQQTDLGQCGLCYRSLYPYYSDVFLESYYRSPFGRRDIRLARAERIISFVARFVEETGYGVDASWIWVNLKLDQDITLITLCANLRLLVKEGRLRKTIVFEGRARIPHYWPIESATSRAEES